MKIKITKASGITEPLNSNKLRDSLLRSGADPDQAKEIIESIISEIDPYTHTKKIYRLARKYLRKINHASGLRYSLKRAIFRLGPSGYPFEKYIGELFRHYGHEVENNVFLEGKCVKHEVDVLAINKREVSFIECKYHNSSGNLTDVKVALYVHSRFQDLRASMKSRYPGKSLKGLLVTNTRCSKDAVQYAECAGLNIISWSYPENKSLQKLIEDKQLYPVTIISGVKSGLVKTLFDHNIVLLKDLAGMDVERIRTMLSLDKKKAAALKKQADELCFC